MSVETVNPLDGGMTEPSQNTEQVRIDAARRWSTVKSSGEVTEEYQEAKQAYLKLCVEPLYQRFTQLYGEVRCDTLSDYVTAWAHFQEYALKGVKHAEVSKYDLGKRFNIDALLNGEQRISPEELSYFREYFLNLMTNYPVQVPNAEGLQADFIAHYPRPEAMTSTIGQLYTKACIQQDIQHPTVIFDSLGIYNAHDAKNLPLVKGWLETIYEANPAYEQISKVAYLQGDWTLHPDLRKDLGPLYKAVAPDDLKSFYETYPHELAATAQRDLGIDLMPTDSLLTAMREE